MSFDLSRLRRVEELKGRVVELIGGSDLIQMAKDGIIPHFVLTNPLTGESTFLFNSAEIAEWFQSHYLHRNDGQYTHRYEFITFDQELHQVPKEEQIPIELSRVKGLFKLPLSIGSTPPAVYFLCKNGKIEYIGQSINVYSRIHGHIAERKKDFDTVYFLPCTTAQLGMMEAALIKHFKPPLNRTHKVPPGKTELELIDQIIEK